MTCAHAAALAGHLAAGYVTIGAVLGHTDGARQGGVTYNLSGGVTCR